MVPSSSAHWATGSTTSAVAAVSDSTTSATTRQVERGEPLLHVPGVRRADDRVAAEEAAAPTGRSRVPRSSQQLVRRAARAGQLVRVDAPDGGDVGARGGVVEPAVAGQLVGLLPVLAAALAVALAGEASRSRSPRGRAGRGRAPG